jgi:hypothetical protein
MCTFGDGFEYLQVLFLILDFPKQHDAICTLWLVGKFAKIESVGKGREIVEAIESYWYRHAEASRKTQ